MTKEHLDYSLDILKKILAIDSPTGYTDNAVKYILEELDNLHFKAEKTNKGGVWADLGGVDKNNAIILSAHIDTLGAMVRAIKSNGRISITNIGGLNANNVETEFCTVVTRGGKKYEGTIQLVNASTHVNGSYSSTQRNFDTIEIVLDELVSSAKDVEDLGISIGDIVCVNPKTVITEKGFIKSRFLDDKLSAAILLGFAKYMKDNKIVPKRQIYLHLTVYEEVGHGAGKAMPEGVTEMLGVDMGCVGDGLLCTERQVSICAKDSSGPYNYEVTTTLINLAKENKIDYAVDIYPHYSSDCSIAVGFSDIKHALIGAGVYASHGYERSHIDGLKNTFDLLEAYLLK